ncbi:DUF2499 domain-containing protein [cyanobacterium endosymbiont of Rhopalodia gibberula]|nr:DUF2499 domain-containing protein [cyanobacterium endosymbiont of Rhopalodia gibberula]
MASLGMLPALLRAMCTCTWYFLLPYFSLYKQS